MGQHHIKILTLALTLFSLNAKANISILHITSFQLPPQAITISGCDTLMIINTSGNTDYFYLDTLQGGIPDGNTNIFPDTMIGQWGNDTSYFYNLTIYSKFFIAHQLNPTSYYITITPCISSDNVLSEIEISNRVFPNPTIDMLFIETSDQISSIDILNLYGQTILKIIPNDKQSFIDTRDLTVGSYFIQIRNKADRQFIKTFTKINSR